MDLVIFDCDGTLVDSEPLAAEALVGLAADFGLPVSVQELLSPRFKGRSMADCVAELERRRAAPLPGTFVEELRRRTAVMLRERLLPLEGALDPLRSLSVPMCMASNGPREKIELSLSTTGLLPFFQGRIFSAYEVGAWKPDPQLYLHAARAMGAVPARCAVVEDSLPGVLGAVAAGMEVFALQTDAHAFEVPAGVYVVPSLVALRRHGAFSNGAASRVHACGVP